MDLAPEFGYVIIAAVINWVVLMYLSINVGNARKKYGIKYPKMYADGKEAETENGNKFNCIQRAHQNMLESLPYFLFFLVVVGLKYPIFSAVCGVVFAVGRLSYAWGYYSGDPSKRQRGFPAFLALLALGGCTLYVGVQMAKSQ